MANKAIEDAQTRKIILLTQREELLQELSAAGKKKHTIEETVVNEHRLGDVKRELKALDKRLTAMIAEDIINSTPDDPKTLQNKLLRDPLAWLKLFCKQHNVDVHNAGMLYDGEEQKHMNFEALAQLEYHRQIDLSDVSGVGSEIFRSGLRIMYRDIKTAHLKEAVARTNYDPAVSDAALRRWLQLLVGETPEFEWYLDVVKHAMQLVKRKMRRMPVDYHLFPIFVGRQGDGKTKALSKLTDALAEFRLELSVEQLADPTIIGCFEENYIVVCDEMARAQKTDIGVLKRAITATIMSGRPPYGSRVENIRQNCTFFGSSNDPVKRIIKDREMRRMVEILTIQRPESSYPEMDALVSEDMWKCIDENNQNCYYKGSRAQIKLNQLEISTREPIQIWAEEFGVLPGKNGVFVPASKLFEHCKEWMREQASYDWTPNLNHFCESLGYDLGLKKERKSMDGKLVTRYLINPSSEILKLDQELGYYNQPILISSLEKI